MYFLLSMTQAGPGRTVKQEQEEISRNHIQTLFYPYVKPKTDVSDMSDNEPKKQQKT